jgi:hypothetical protein
MENVDGACSCQLGKLKAIQANLRLQGERVRQQIQARAPVTAPVPSIAEAVNEVARLRSLPPNRVIQGSGADLGRILMDEALRATGQVEVTLHTEEPVGPPAVSGQGYQRVARREYPVSTRHASMTQNRIALEQLWSGRGDVPEGGPGLEDMWVADMENEYQPGGPLDVDTGDITFDDGIDIEFENNNDWAGSAPRFRVDRGAPARTPFVATMEPGPADGVVVGNIREPRGRVASMSIREVRERAQQISRDNAQSVGLMREGPVQTRQATRAEAERARADRGQSVVNASREADQQQRPTVYDRLRRKSFLDE